MYYPNIRPARFLERPNRFIALCELEGETVRAHVKNTGRCAELLTPGAQVFLQPAPAGAERKTRFSLISVYRGDMCVNIDSQAPNRVFDEAVSAGNLRLPGMDKLCEIRREAIYGDSRLDFFLRDEKRAAYVEIKGVTLLEGSVARFPDAPTERGIKHLEALSRAAEAGYQAYAVFVIQLRGAVRFEPNERTHAAFGESLRRAVAKGVFPVAVDCTVTPDSIAYRGFVPVHLGEE